MSHYFSDPLEKHAQRFIRPIYIKDELGHYKYGRVKLEVRHKPPN
ncbi:hypothetical protein [Acinetobacter soli]|nr:hypothetical protein [Acinetobacter soli]